MDEPVERDETRIPEGPTSDLDGGSGPDGLALAADETTDLGLSGIGSGAPLLLPQVSLQGDPTSIGRYRVIRRLGQGGFGRVYLAHDDELDRPVAIKVPNPDRVAVPDDIKEYLAEARSLARLDHPNIVPVHDVGRTGDGLCYVVSKYIEGNDLAEQLGRGRPTIRESAELVAVVAEALHHAHARGLVHRDIKPANILLDVAGRPCVADFGLALRDEDYGKESGTAGTPAYMSPEQARGEGHRVDGRSDIFSLGIVLYELLAGRRPFRGDSHAEVLRQVATAEPRPPRQLDDAIPRELERICLKALAKRASERYTTARDLAEDLRHFLEAGAAAGSPTTVPGVAASPPGSTREATPTPPAHGLSNSSGSAVRVVPKGLRSFDRNDADFFLELLPGARDRDGLPEGLRFWKARIESGDPESALKVGLIYGPSGCGKTSMVKAGMLPRLGREVLAVYIEATPEETEVRLLRGLCKTCPDLPPGRGLVDSMATLRRGSVLRAGQKVLVVLDQFEQWLFARRGDEDTELVAALRHCDGERVQAIVMVRDDFWMAATRFMRELEIDLVPDRNIAAVDLFGPRHARKVLAAFGRAYGALPERTAELSKDHEAFLDQAVAGLAQDGKVIPVRLALFAEMVKAKAWSPSTLRAIGGTEGVGVTFLEETFASPQANPKHRLHRKAAQDVLAVLLPRTGADIKGQMRSEAELRDASGYAGRPREFDELVRILDQELRLIAPTDPLGVTGGGWLVEGGSSDDRAELPSSEHRPGMACGAGTESDAGPEGRVAARGGTGELVGADRPHQQDVRRPSQGAGKSPGDPTATPPSTLHAPPSTPRYYQLTHDYLVPALRDWLTRKQRETRRGRAELRLAERAALWESRPQNRLLPSVLEWASFRALTRPKDWNDPQRRMMRRAGRFHGSRGLLLVVLIALAAWGSVEGYGNLRASALVDSLRTAGTTDVPPIIGELSKYRRWADPRLRRMVRDSDDQGRDRLHAGLALLEVDATQVDYLYDRLLKAAPSELRVLGEALEPHRSRLVPRLWAELDSARPGDDRLLRSAGALAFYTPGDARWTEFGGKVAQALVTVNSLVIGPWLEALRPVRGKLTTPLASIFRDQDRSETVRSLTTDILADYARDDPELLAELLMVSGPKPYLDLFPAVERQAVGVVPIFRAELARQAMPAGKGPPLDRSGTKPGPSSSGEQAGDELAERQARAAVALIRLGHAGEVWPLLRHGVDPRLRSFMVNGLEPLGADPHAVAAELDRLASAGRLHPGPAGRVPGDSAVDSRPFTEAVLFDPTTSTRRALIQALGTYAPDVLSRDEREPLIAGLFELYEHDADAGIHAAAEWTLRRWNRAENVDRVDVRLRGEDRGPRRWYVNGQGQAFARVEGPVEFRMGSPPDELDREPDETLHPRVIPRRFAIAIKEVTVEQYRRFARDNPQFGVDQGYLNKFSPEPDGPMVSVTWFGAAAYCNWLSQQEGVPEDQWCYRPNERGSYDEKMRIPADALRRTGYRLPTEAEWEYACRAGTVTRHYHGPSIDLLGAYARYQANGQDHAWKCGSLLPNDLGLFDMLGNVYEWCHDRQASYDPEKTEQTNSEIIDVKHNRVYRGGVFYDRPALVRSAFRDGNTPSYRIAGGGFRLARTER